MDQKRSPYASQTQKAALVEEVKINPQLISGRFSTSFTKKDAQKQWEGIALKINAIPGAHKTWRQWRKTWQDYRTGVKKQQSAINKHARGTGGGPPLHKTLSAAEEQILDLINPISIHGHENVAESSAKFDFSREFMDVDSSDTEEVEVCGTQESSTLLRPESGLAVDPVPSCSGGGSELGNNTQKNLLVLEPVPSCSKEGDNLGLTPKKNISGKKNTPAARHRLTNSIVAAQNLAEQSVKKLELKESYYNRKLALIKENMEQKERFRNRLLEIKTKKVKALEDIRDSLAKFVEK